MGYVKNQYDLISVGHKTIDSSTVKIILLDRHDRRRNTCEMPENVKRHIIFRINRSRRTKSMTVGRTEDEMLVINTP